MFTKLGSLLSVTCRHCSVQARAVETAFVYLLFQLIDSEGRFIEIVLGTEFFLLWKRRPGDNKTRPTTGADSSHGKSAQAPTRFVILHSVYDSLGGLAIASERNG